MQGGHTWYKQKCIVSTVDKLSFLATEKIWLNTTCDMSRSWRKDVKHSSIQATMTKYLSGPLVESDDSDCLPHFVLNVRNKYMALESSGLTQLCRIQEKMRQF